MGGDDAWKVQEEGEAKRARKGGKGKELWEKSVARR